MNLRSRLRWLFRRQKVDAEMAEEMRLHLELQTERNGAAGMSADEARYAAQREFGGVEQIKEQCRDQRGFVWLEQLQQDTRYAVRALTKNRGFTFAAVTILALGIGANAAIFNLVQTLLFTPPAYQHPEEVVRVLSQNKKDPKVLRDFSYPTYLEVRDRNDVFSSTLAYRLTIAGVGSLGGETRCAMVGLVTSNYFSTLGVVPVQGRAFFPAEESPGRATPVAVVSYQYWKARNFSADLMGSSLRINGQLFTIVGIAPKGFTGAPHLFATEVWLPLSVYDLLMSDVDANQHTLSERAGGSLIVLGRLKAGLTLKSAAAPVAALAANLEKAYPVEQLDQTFRLEHPSRFATGANDRSVQWVGVLLLGMATIVLLVACLNLASLLLARGNARRKEIAIRMAIGGGRARIIRQLVTEGFVLASLGGVAGLLVALWSADLLVASLGKLAPIELAWSIGLNPATILATFGFCVLATTFFALGPALKLSRSDVSSSLKENAAAESSQRRRGWRPRNLVLVAQLAFSLALLTAAALFIRGAGRAGEAIARLNLDRVVLLELDSTLRGLNPTQAKALFARVGERIAALPNVEAMSVSVDVPLGGLDLEKRVRRVGEPDQGKAESSVKWNGVGVDFFKTTQLPLLRGRPFALSETMEAKSAPVVIVNEVLAKDLWPRGDAVGQRLQFLNQNATATTADTSANGATPSGAETFEVIGVVPAAPHNLFEAAPDSAVYLPFARGFQSHVFFHVKFSALTAGTENTNADLLRRVVAEVDPSLPVLSVKTFSQHLDNNLQVWIVRAGATIFSAFGGLALCLAAVGIYGVIAFSVARRTREIGIRMALGAQRSTVQGMILREGGVTLAGGVAIGLLFAVATGKIVSSLLYHVSALDPIALAFAPSLLIGAGMIACWLPARRAAKVDPMVALRCE